MSRSLSEMIRRFNKEAWNDRRLDAPARYLHPHAIVHRLAGYDVIGADNFRELIQRPLLEAFPRLEFEIEDIIESEDRAVYRWRALIGTGDGSAGVLPPGKTIETGGMTWLRREGNLVVEVWDGWDQTSFFQRLCDPHWRPPEPDP